MASYIDELLSANFTKHNETILVVEDSVMENKMICNILKKEGYTVLSAMDGAEGLEILQANITNIDLVVCDIYLPKMTGVRLLETLKNDKNLSYIPPFIFMSVANRHSVAIDVKRTGASDFITKPFDAIELKLRIEKELKLQHLLKVGQIIE